MELNAFSAVFLVVLYATLALQLWLNHRQRRHLARSTEEVPELLREKLTRHDFRRVTNYGIEHNRITDPEWVIASLLPLWWSLGGGIDLMVGWLGKEPGVLAGTAAILGVLVLNALVMLPIRAWRHFEVDLAYGFSRQSLAEWMVCRLKSGIGLIVLGGPLVLAALSVIMHTVAWWFWLWLLWLTLLVTAYWFAPRLLPVDFHRLMPLPDGEAHEQDQGPGTTSGASPAPNQGRPAPQHGSKSHVLLEWLGDYKGRRAAFELRDRLTPDAAAAVLAHELNHHRRSYLRRRLIVSGLGSLLGLTLLAWLADNPSFHTGLGVSDPAPWTMLLLLLLIGPVCARALLQPMENLLAQRTVYDQDRHIAHQVGADVLETALIRRYRDNGLALTADPPYTVLNSTYPPLRKRIEALRAEHPSAGVPNRG